MYKAIFLDDEAITLQLLQEAIDWDSYGIEIAGTARDGEEGLALFHAVNPDIVIADICMPKLTGIGFVEQVRQNNTKVKLVLLTAYADFEYAHKAISLRVDDYLLKPLDECELENLIVRFVRELKQRDISLQTESKHHAERIQYQLEVVAQMYGSSRWSLEFSNWFDTVQALQANIKDVALLSLGAVRGTEAYWFIYQNLCGVLRDVLGEKVLLAELPDGICLILGSFTANGLHAVCQRMADLTVEIHIGWWANNGLPGIVGFEEARCALQVCFYTEVGVVDKASSNILLCEGELPSLKEYEQAVKQMVETGQSKKLQKILFCIIDRLATDYAHPRQIQLFAQQLISWLHISMFCRYGDQGAASVGTIAAKFFLCCATKTMLCRLCMEKISAASLWVTGYYEDTPKHQAIRAAKEYTLLHFSEPDLSLQVVADHVFLSKNHFSSLFHQVTGQKYWDYLTEYRIEVAKHWLRGGECTISEVMYRVGYENESHFSKKFKEIVGASPKSYRNR